MAGGDAVAVSQATNIVPSVMPVAVMGVRPPSYSRDRANPRRRTTTAPCQNEAWSHFTMPNRISIGTSSRNSRKEHHLSTEAIFSE